MILPAKGVIGSEDEGGAGINSHPSIFCHQKRRSGLASGVNPALVPAAGHRRIAIPSFAPCEIEDPAAYALSSFTYKYHLTYGSPPIEVARAVVRKAIVAADGLSVRLGVAGLREAFIHEIKAPGVRAATGTERALLHDTVYYTLNRRPELDRILAKEEETPEFCDPTVAASSASAKRQTNPPATWNGKIDQTIVLGAERGLKFDRTELTVRPGAKIRLTLRNNDEMLHNFLLCAPDSGNAMGDAAAAMGVVGPEKWFAPDLPAVLAHTSLLQPGASETIYFAAPTVAGRYEFICSFPGHAALMRGVLLVSIL